MSSYPLSLEGRAGEGFFLLLLALVLLYRLGRDGCGGLGLRGVVLLNVSCGSGDSPPCLATTDADEYGGHDYRTKQNNCP